MQVEKVRVDASKKGRIICPKCQKEKSINAVSFRMNQDIKVTCECKHVYYIRFDQRRHSRKKVKLTGRFHKIDEEPTKLIHIEICDLSVSGLSFRRKNIENLREGDVLALTFILDNHEQSEIKTKASIRYVKETRVGIRFDESEESNQDLLRNYFSASTTRGTNANLRRELRLLEESRYMKAAKEELEKYGSTAGVAYHQDFSGNTWDEAVQRFRSSWANRYICNHCQAITDFETASTSQFRCGRCAKGRYTSSPKEIWDIILTHSPHRERYLTLGEAVSTFSVEISEFKKHYPHGFLVPRVQNIFDNTLISTIRNALMECKKLGVAFTTDNILVKKIKANIRIIRKRSYDYHQEKIIIGRSGTSDIVFDHDDVSRNHAYIYCDIMNNKVYLIDNDSSNGTFINGEKITPRQPSILSDNDEIAFGRKARVIYLSPVGFYNLLHTMAATNEEAAGSSGVPVEESVR